MTEFLHSYWLHQNLKSRDEKLLADFRVTSRLSLGLVGEVGGMGSAKGRGRIINGGGGGGGAATC